MATAEFTDEGHLEALQDIPIFQDISNDDLLELLGHASQQVWTKKTCILDTKTTLYKFYIVLKGRIKAYNFDHDSGRQAIIHLMYSGDFFDVCTLMRGVEHKLYYETIDDAAVLCIPIMKMRSWISRHPSIINQLLNDIICKMQKLEANVADLSLEDTETRFAKLLINNMNARKNCVEKINDLSHDELARLIGTSRAVLNRQIQVFKAEGILRISRKNIEILDYPSLLAKIPMDFS